MRKQAGFYRCLWSEDAKSIPFTWHRTERGAETIPKAYRYDGYRISTDYYHHMVEGAKGLEEYAAESGMHIDWEASRLIYKKDGA